MKKQLYIAAPFFTPPQLETIKSVEQAIMDAGLIFYSPRLDGVLKEMLPEERKARARDIFNLNVRHIINADGVLCILDDKDTGTTWENGFAYYHRRYNIGKHSYRLFSYTTSNRELNVMLQQSFDYHAKGIEELKTMLTAYGRGDTLPKPAPVSDVY